MSDERVTRLETYREGDQADILNLTKQVGEIHTDVQIIKLHLEKQKGFLAGVMFIVLPIWSVITAGAVAAWEYLKEGAQ